MGLLSNEFYDLVSDVRGFVDKIDRAITLGNERISKLEGEIANKQGKTQAKVAQLQSKLGDEVSKRESEQETIRDHLKFLDGVGKAFKQSED